MLKAFHESFKVVRLVVFAVCVCAFVLAANTSVRAASLADVVNNAANSADGILNSYEFRSTSFKALPQWQAVVGKIQAKDAAFALCANGRGGCSDEHERIWKSLLDNVRGMSQYDALVYVNGYFNQWPYKEDINAFGLREYWASPKEFMQYSGDCEDYAIAKYFILRSAGFTQEQLRITAVQDTIRGLGHAVLVVKVAGKNYVLDNLTDMVLDETRFSHYVPQFSVNETARWTHTPKSRGYGNPGAEVAYNAR